MRHNPRKYHVLAVAMAAAATLASNAAHAQSTDGSYKVGDHGEIISIPDAPKAAARSTSQPPRITIPAKTVAACRDGRVTLNETGTLTQAEGGTANAMIGKIGKAPRPLGPGC